MDERYVFVIAAVLAEVEASASFFALSPASPICTAFMGWLSYAGQHASLALLLWALGLAAAWFYAGPQLLRLHQSTTTKLNFLAKLGFAGLVIDNIVSIYQLESSSEFIVQTASTSSILVGLAERSALYVAGFAGVVLVALVLSRRQTPTVTPPPRFGRE